MKPQIHAALAAAVLAAALVAQPAAAAKPARCKLTPKQVVTEFMTEFYLRKNVRKAFETWVDPGSIQHNPMAATGRDAAIAFLEPFFASNPAIRYEIKRVIADGKLVVELKVVSELAPIHEAQLLTYMKLTKCRVGLLINFNVVKLRDGIRRMAL